MQEGEGMSDNIVERERGGGEERKKQKEQLYAHAREKEIEGTQGGSGRGKSPRPSSGNDVLMLARTCVHQLHEAHIVSCYYVAL